jgi:predicted nucleic acid-binding Zn ribbon protein
MIRRKRTILLDKVCPICNKSFKPFKIDQKYCSEGCSKRFYYDKWKLKHPSKWEKKELKCKLCDKAFIPNQSNQKYCSKECYNYHYKLAYREALNGNFDGEFVQKLKKFKNNTFLKLRWEVFKRDGFKCQYCGRGINEKIILQVEHIIPKSKGGETILNNLITSCFECNSGKGDDLLSLRELKNIKENYPM